MTNKQPPLSERCWKKSPPRKRGSQSATQTSVASPGRSDRPVRCHQNSTRYLELRSNIVPLNDDFWLFVNLRARKNPVHQWLILRRDIIIHCGMLKIHSMLRPWGRRKSFVNNVLHFTVVVAVQRCVRLGNVLQADPESTGWIDQPPGFGRRRKTGSACRRWKTVGVTGCRHFTRRQKGAGAVFSDLILRILVVRSTSLGLI